ncbi:hypothetical protein BWQ96_09384 [Gracilariopsis chorda]|uniref:Uncharacterized protein n=1 Tax=Gracilariopsis chorda TaxID=448386 RepID=A0A2V3IFQ6_9FLOR|nr:hypothetical protein BWQ96_09384 [Gracilariopsis chorda]|eukprot:PXF40891.1 hypothetical protein BWQ96_09384 [Gracilariopsis chorda]
MESSYGKHFTAYCRKRKQAVQQRVPAAVWKLVYKDYLDDGKAKCEIAGVQFDKDVPQERTLQNALRSALDDVQTGVSDVPGQQCDLQNDDLMQKLKESDTYNKKKMGDFRESLISQSTTNSDDSGSESVIDLVPEEKTQVEEKISLANPSKKKLLRDTVTAISSMVTVVEEKSDNLCRAVEKQTMVQENDVVSGKTLREEQLKSLQSKEVNRQIKQLILLREQGIISEVELTERVKVIVEL